MHMLNPNYEQLVHSFDMPQQDLGHGATQGYTRGEDKHIQRMNE